MIQWVIIHVVDMATARILTLFRDLNILTSCFSTFSAIKLCHTLDTTSLLLCYSGPVRLVMLVVFEVLLYCQRTKRVEV